MPVAIQDGPLGLEGQHQWGTLLLNGPNDIFPRIHLDKITGLHSMGELDAKSEPNTARLGEHAYPSLLRGKTVTYEGRVIARSFQEMRAVSTALRGAFASNHSTERQMIISPAAGYGTQKFSFTARCISLDMDDEQTNGPTTVPYPYQRAFVVGLRLSDSRSYAYPDAADYSGTTNLDVVNLGTAPTDPVIQLLNLTGTRSDPHWLRNVTSGRQIYFTTLPGLGDITVDFHARTITQVGQGDISGYLNVPASDWWDAGVAGLRPGANGLTCFGGNLHASFYHAFW